MYVTSLSHAYNSSLKQFYSALFIIIIITIITIIVIIVVFVVCTFNCDIEIVWFHQNNMCDFCV